MKFKVGDTITYEGADCTGIIKRIYGETLWCDWSNGDKNLNVSDYSAILVTKGNGRQPKPEGRRHFKVLKDECNNYVETIKADTVLQAVKAFKKNYKGRDGYTLYEPVTCTTKEVKVKFKSLK